MSQPAAAALYAVQSTGYVTKLWHKTHVQHPAANSQMRDVYQVQLSSYIYNAYTSTMCPCDAVGGTHNIQEQQDQ